MYSQEFHDLKQVKIIEYFFYKKFILLFEIIYKKGFLKK